MKVYLVYVGQYDDMGVESVFLSKDKALARIAALKTTAKYSMDMPRDEPDEFEVTE